MSNKRLFGRDTGESKVLSATIANTTPVPSSVIPLEEWDTTGCQLITTGSLVGAWTIAISNDYTGASNGPVYSDAAGNAGTWTDITAAFNPAIAAVSSAGSQAVVMTTMPFKKAQITFTATSGSGTAVALVFQKNIG